jgi:hypothetical protein
VLRKPLHFVSGDLLRRLTDPLIAEPATLASTDPQGEAHPVNQITLTGAVARSIIEEGPSIPIGQLLALRSAAVDPSRSDAAGFAIPMRGVGNRPRGYMESHERTPRGLQP